MFKLQKWTDVDQASYIWEFRFVGHWLAQQIGYVKVVSKQDLLLLIARLIIKLNT